MTTKRLMMTVALALVVSLVFSTAAIADGPRGPAEKATGDVGYTAFGLQRYADFNAHEKVTACSSTWSLMGNWALRFVYGGTNYDHDMVVAMQTNGDLSGTGGFPAGEPPYTVTWTMTGTLSGDAVTLYVTYVTGNPGYTFTATGTIAPDGTMSGTWTSNTGQSGTWSTLTGAAYWEVPCTGKGQFHYWDMNDDWYYADVQYTHVEGDMAYFAGPVTSASQPGWTSYWVMVAVKDYGEPGRTGDQIWGVFTDMATAIYHVQVGIAPDGAFDITSGNLTVHTYE